jgi:hypothetical protein
VSAAMCPKCRFPLSRQESRSGKCPFCGTALELPDAAGFRSAALPPPVDERAARLPVSQFIRPFVRGAFILFVLAAGGGGIYYLVSNGVTRFLGGTDAPAQAAFEKPAPPGEAPVVAQRPSKGAPPSAQPAPPPAAEAKGDVPPVLPREIVVTGTVRKIDGPQGEYSLEPLNGGTQVRLRGKVKRLRIGSLNGDAVLEAETLEAQEVIFTGAINGNARARVNAPNGSVEFRAPVAGQPKVYVDAPNGKVTFAKPAGGKAGADIDGEAKITIKAKEVDFQCPINGAGTYVQVVFSAGGKMRFTEMGGRSQLLYRRADARDPDPVIGWGIVRDNARCKENK